MRQVACSTRSPASRLCCGCRSHAAALLLVAPIALWIAPAPDLAVLAFEAAITTSNFAGRPTAEVAGSHHRQLSETDAGGILLELEVTTLARNTRVLRAIYETAESVFDISVQTADSLYAQSCVDERMLGPNTTDINVSAVSAVDIIRATQNITVVETEYVYLYVMGGVIPPGLLLCALLWWKNRKRVRKLRKQATEALILAKQRQEAIQRTTRQLLRQGTSGAIQLPRTLQRQATTLPRTLQRQATTLPGTLQRQATSLQRQATSLPRTLQRQATTVLPGRGGHSRRFSRSPTQVVPQVSPAGWATAGTGAATHGSISRAQVVTIASTREAQQEAAAIKAELLQARAETQAAKAEMQAAKDEAARAQTKLDAAGADITSLRRQLACASSGTCPPPPSFPKRIDLQELRQRRRTAADAARNILAASGNPDATVDQRFVPGAQSMSELRAFVQNNSGCLSSPIVASFRSLSGQNMVDDGKNALIIRPRTSHAALSTGAIYRQREPSQREGDGLVDL